MNQELTKEVAKKLMEIKGEIRGDVLKTDGEYILKEKGEEGLKRLEEELERLGYPIKYKEIETLNFYPIGLAVISNLAIMKVFNFDEKKIEEIGFYATKTSFLVRIFVRYFLSLRRVFEKEAPKMWREHFTIGELIPVELNEEKKYAILRLKNFKLHPIYCHTLGGFFCGIGQMLIKSPQITFEETKCEFKGDEYHEYLIKW